MFKKLINLLMLGTLVVSLFLAGLVFLFDTIEERKGLIEQFGSKMVGQRVSSEAIISTWRNGNPQLLIRGLTVESSSFDTPDLKVDELAIDVSWSSLLRFWPKIELATINGLSLRIESLPMGGVRIGGWLIPPREDRQPPERFLRWIADQSGIFASDSDIEWRNSDGEVERYTDVSLVYALENDYRVLHGVLASPEGDLLIRSEFLGNPFESASDWQGEFVIAAVGVSANDTSSGISMSSRSGLGLLRIPQIDLPHLRDLMVIAGVLPKLGIWMQQADAKGLLQDFELRFTGDVLDLDSWDASASITGISFDATETSPAGNNLAARLQINSQGGLISLDSQNVSIRWPHRIAGGVDIDQLKAELLWNVVGSKAQIRVSDGQALAEQGSIKNFEAAIMFADGGADGDISMKFDIPDISVIKDFVPLHLSGKTHDWFAQAFPTGALKNGQLGYRGPISIDAVRSSTGDLSASADAINVVVDYGGARNWPPIRQADARLSLVQDRLVADPSKATIYQSEFQSGQVVLENLFERGGRVLSIREAEIKGPTEDALQFLLEGPLFDEGNRPELDMVAHTGEYMTRFSAELPLTNLNASTVSGFGEVTQANLTLPLGTTADGVKAAVKYTQESVTGSGEIESYLGGRAAFSVETLANGRPPEVQLNAGGRLVPAYLAGILGEPLANSLAGETDWQGTMNFDSGPVRMRIESDLIGLIIALPEPVYKGAGELRPLAADIEFARVGGLTKVRYDVGENLRGVLNTRANGDEVVFESGDLVYGQQPLMEDFPVGGLGVRIEADEIDLDPWLDYMIWVSEGWPEIEGEASSFVSALHRVTLAGQKVRLFDKQLGRMNLIGQSMDGLHWAIDAIGDSLEGQLEAAPANEAPFYIADFKFLDWPASEPDVGTEVDDLKPYEYPIISIHADDFRFDGRELGELNIVARPEGESWNIARLDMIQPALTILATGVWELSGAGLTQTTLDFLATTPESGEALSALGLGDFLDGGGLDLEGTARWSGPPSAYSVPNLDATYRLAANKGKLVGVDPKAGRLLGLLNLNSLSRRLRLDFSDVFSNGFAFDNLGSEGTIYEGNLAVQEFYVVGPSAYIESQGRIGIADEDYDLELVVSPQLGSNIALLSALANPAAGAMIFIAQRLFEDQLNDALRYSYTITGNWSEPDFNRTKIEPEIPLESEAITDGGIVGEATDSQVEEVYNSVIEQSENPEAEAMLQ
ncbi:MAG TPA: hypothetical protein DCY55_03890 [Gammaproteobacteria bacterium]|nr:hypothetical protein [Pseudomonadota bacterium]HAY45407.1 hypothetical protein [Gammaproteobacteria bacterium]